MFNHSIRKLHGRLKANNISPLDIFNHCLEKLKAAEDLNIFINLNPTAEDLVQNSTHYFIKGNPRSFIEGIPIAIKDNFCLKNLQTTCGSKMLRDFKPPFTATVVEKLLNAGGVILGKTNMDEFAMGSGTTTSIFGPTKNFWGSEHLKNTQENENDWFIPGGSSGGSAVAVACGACYGALGSDTGGSVRNPASYCGIVGLKPTYGLLSRHGLIPLVNSMDVPGILALNVEDAAILLELTAGYDKKDSTTVSKNIDLNINFSTCSVKGLKVGIPKEYNCDNLSEEVRSTWNDVAKILKSGGATVLPVSMPHTKYSIVCYSILNQCEVASNMARYDGLQYGYRSDNENSVNQMFAKTRSAGFNEVVKSRILAGNYFLLAKNYENYFMKALKVRRLIIEDFNMVWDQKFDILLTPTTLTDAPRHSDYITKDEREQSASQDYCTQPANMAGIPAVSIPIKLSKNKLPLSVQLMAPSFQEKKLLETAYCIEKAVNFSQYR